METSVIRFREPKEVEGASTAVPNLENDVEQVCTRVDQLEQKLTEVEKFYMTANKKLKGSSTLKDKDKEKQITSLKKQQQDTTKKEAAAAKRMQALMHEFSEIISDITQHKWAGPFLQPVDVVGLGLDDYYQVIEKPMDFSTIKAKMETNDSSGYNNVREICADVRLIFKNAIKYNDAKEDVHVMAQSLLSKFEEKWLKLLPKVEYEERRRKEEEIKAQIDLQAAQEAAHAKMAGELRAELDAVDVHLDQLRDAALQKCRKLTIEEKKRLGDALTRLSTEELNQALEIVSQDNPAFHSTGEQVELELDTQSDATLWKLKIFVKDALQLQQRSSTNNLGGNTNNNNNNNMVSNNNQNNNSKRKRETSDAPVKTSQKKSRKPSK